MCQGDRKGSPLPAALDTNLMPMQGNERRKTILKQKPERRRNDEEEA